MPSYLLKQTNCRGKQLCGIVYMAPWCPACNGIIPQLKVLLKQSLNHPTFGMQVIVGQGQSEGDNERKAKEIGDNVLVDNEQVYASALKVGYFPKFLVVDSLNNLTAEDQKAIDWMNKAFIQP